MLILIIIIIMQMGQIQGKRGFIFRMIVIRVNSLSDVNTTLLAMTEFLQEVVSILNLSFSSLFRSLDNQKLILWYRRMNERTNERPTYGLNHVGKLRLIANYRTRPATTTLYSGMTMWILTLNPFPFYIFVLHCNRFKFTQIQYEYMR